eukprot:285654_1
MASLQFTTTWTQIGITLESHWNKMYPSITHHSLPYVIRTLYPIILAIRTHVITALYVDYDFANKEVEIKIDSDYKRRLLRKKQKQKLINGMHALSAQKRKQDASENERKEDQSGNEDNDVEMINANNTNRRSRLRNMFGA